MTTFKAYFIMSRSICSYSVMSDLPTGIIESRPGYRRFVKRQSASSLIKARR